jgi:hypothetical protein
MYLQEIILLSFYFQNLVLKLYQIIKKLHINVFVYEKKIANLLYRNIFLLPELALLTSLTYIERSSEPFFAILNCK